MKTITYIIISPVRNEEQFLSATLRSVTGQTILPAKWIIVNDGSTDRTGDLGRAAARKHNWIRVIDRADRGFRKSGAGVMDAFYEGYRLVESERWEFLVKLDGDLEFQPDFFERLLAAFAGDPTLGIAGGDIYHERAGQTVIESSRDPAFHVRGATKVYSRACWEAIGGLVPATGWDTLDEVKANMVGYSTRRIPAAKALHLRPTGAADGSWRDAFKNGRGGYISGYHPLYMISKCVRRLGSRPFLIYSAGLCTGFFSSYFSRVERISDRALIRYLRKQQLRRLVGLPSIWR